MSQFSRELRLRRALEPLKDGVYDFVLIDCPPSLGLLTVNALAAADELIVPIQCEYYALEGLGQLLRNVRLVQQNVNPGLHLTGIVLTMYDPRTKLSEQVVEEVRRFFGDRVYETVIPRTVRLSEAPGFGQPITVYDPKSRGAECYRSLAREVAARLPSEAPIPSVEGIPKVVVPPSEPQPMQAPRPLRRTGGQAEEAVAAEVEADGTVAADRAAEPAGGHGRAEEGDLEGAAEGARGAEGEDEAEVDLDRAEVAATEAARASQEPEGAEEVEGPPREPARSEPTEAGSGADREPVVEPVVEGTLPSPDADGTEALIAALEAEREREAPRAREPVASSERPERPPRVLEIELDEEEGVARGPDEAGVVRIVDRDAAGEHGGAGPEGEPPPKRRWRLFRRGGDR
ncbi:Sporulation initiation inhibitor protein Soj [bacterium HR12]|nr:Sporulation initiation inhibitor protein Soj [bacterium HR12]